MASLFGIPAAALPLDWAGFEAYNRAMLMSDRLGVNALSREMANRLLHGRGSWIPIPHWYRALTAAWLPERLRAEFGLKYGKREEQAVAKALNLLPRIYCGIPVLLRFVGPYFEARARLLSRHVGPMIGLSNRFWMGRARMMFSEPER